MKLATYESYNQNRLILRVNSGYSYFIALDNFLQIPEVLQSFSSMNPKFTHLSGENIIGAFYSGTDWIQTGSESRKADAFLDSLRKNSRKV